MPAKKARKAPSEEPAEPEKKREEEVVAVAAEPEKKREEEVVAVAAEPEKREPTPSAAIPSTDNNVSASVVGNPQPTEQQIREAIVAMLQSADLDEISIKKIRKELEERFNCPMKEKKEMIKQIVTESIGMGIGGE